MAERMAEWQNGRMAEMATYVLSIPPFNCHSTIPPFRHSAIPPFHVLFMVHADVNTDDTDDDNDDELHANTGDDDDNDDDDDNNDVAISAILPFCHSFCHSAQFSYIMVLWMK